MTNQMSDFVNFCIKRNEFLLSIWNLYSNYNSQPLLNPTKKEEKKPSN